MGERGGRPLLTDAVGELGTTAAGWVVRTRRGPVEIARDAVVAVRAVPPAPPRRAPLAAVVRLERLCADAWPAAVDEPLGAWRLRAAGGFTGRANSALALGDPGLPLPAALARVRGFAAAHGVAPRVQVPVGSPWDRAVAAEGWVLDEAHAAGPVVSVRVAELTPTPDGGGGGWSARPGPGWWEVGEPAGPAARGVLDPADGPALGFGLVRDAAGTPVGRVRAALVEDHVHVSALRVVPAARRRGLGRALLAGAAAWGRERGARRAVLQVAVDSAATELYAAAGFTEHHRYRYLVPRSAGGPAAAPRAAPPP